MSRPKKKTERLAERLKKEHRIDADPSTFERVYAGHWQRSSGAWSWWMFLREEKDRGRQTIGSQFSVTELLKMEKWTVDLLHVSEFVIEPA